MNLPRLLASAAIMVCSSAAFARGLVVSPSQLGLIGAAGSTVSDVILVSSSREEQNNIQVALSDFTRDEAGQVLELTPADASRSCREWLEIDQTSFTTPEIGRIELQVTARIPKDAAGSYWALVAFRSLPPARTPGQGNTVRIIPRIVVPVIVTVSGTETRVLKITDMQVKRAGTGLDAEISVRNDGNAAVLFSGALTLERAALNGDLTELAESPIDTLTSLPGMTTRIKAHIDWNASSSGLRLAAIVRFGPGASDVVEHSIPVEPAPSASSTSTNDGTRTTSSQKP